MATIRTGRPPAMAQGSISSASASTTVQPPPALRLQLAQMLREARVALDRHQAPDPGIQEGPGQPAGARADLQHRGGAQIARGGGDAAQDRRVEQEMLAQPLVGVQALGAQPAARGGRRGQIRTSTNASRRRSRR